MDDLPISQYMKNFFKKKNITFTDFERATIFWNSMLTLQERLDAVKKIADCTKDEELRKQITERIGYEAAAYECFKRNDGKYIYVTDPDDEEVESHYFTKLDDAVAYGLEAYDDGFCVEKFIPAENAKDGRSGHSAGWTSYNNDGSIRNLRCSKVGYDIYDNCDWRHRFENNYIFLKDQPFEIGDIVHYMADDKDEYGIVGTSHQAWREWEERFRKDGRLTYDISDLQLRVEYPSKYGYWYHRHCCILALEKAGNIENETKRRMLEAAGNIMGYDGNKSLENFTYCCEEYGKEMKAKPE